MNTSASFTSIQRVSALSLPPIPPTVRRAEKMPMRSTIRASYLLLRRLFSFSYFSSGNRRLFAASESPIFYENIGSTVEEQDSEAAESHKPSGLKLKMGLTVFPILLAYAEGS